MQSQNGWPVVTSSTSVEMIPLSWVTGRIRAGDVHAILDAFCARFNAEVEPITAAWSWGYAYRAIRGASTGYSNHASGTAIDLNAPMHPLGKSGTFSAAQDAAIRRILADLGGVIRWGGDYSGRKDPMHFEVIASAANLAGVVARLGSAATAAHTPTPITPEDDMFEPTDRTNVEETRKYLAILEGNLSGRVDVLLARLNAVGQGLEGILAPIGENAAATRAFLGPMLQQILTDDDSSGSARAFSDAELARVATAVADEQHRRSAA